jgi:hypothetical protein
MSDMLQLVGTLIQAGCWLITFDKLKAYRTLNLQER